MAKFMQVINDEKYKVLETKAKDRGISVQELIRAVIIPEWLKLGYNNQNPSSIDSYGTEVQGKGAYKDQINGSEVRAEVQTASITKGKINQIRYQNGNGSIPQNSQNENGHNKRDSNHAGSYTSLDVEPSQIRRSLYFRDNP